MADLVFLFVIRILLRVKLVLFQIETVHYEAEVSHGGVEFLSYIGCYSKFDRVTLSELNQVLKFCVWGRLGDSAG